MKRLGFVAIVSCLALASCDNVSRLDKTTSKMPSKAETATAPADTGAAKLDRSGTLEERVARLEDNFAKYGEALDFLAKVYAQQKQQQEAQERSEPAPDAVFAVDISANEKLGLVEGPKTALVTIIEAWDFA
jgi:hypothetical protein